MSDQKGYRDAEAHRILERAAEIDAEQSRRLDAPALREIAAEAGISPAAVDRALQEYASPAVVRESFLKRHPVLLTLAVIGGALVLLALSRIVIISP